MTPNQCWEARRLLGWTRKTLALKSGTYVEVVGAYENSGRVIVARAGSEAPNYIEALTRALEAAGSEFTNGDAPVVRLKRVSP